MKKRMDYLDVAKGIAMFLVVMGHAALWFLPALFCGRLMMEAVLRVITPEEFDELCAILRRFT